MKQNVWSKIACALAVYLLFVMLVPAAALGETYTCDGVTFTGLTDVEQLKTSGNYYLTGDLTFTNEGNCIEIPADITVNLCLHGYSIYDKVGGYFTNGTIFHVSGSLSLYDCTGNSRITSTGNAYLSPVISGIVVDGGSVTINGGTIQNCTKGIVLNSGSVTMNGGSVTGCGWTISNPAIYRADGGGVAVKGGSFTMNGGQIVGNSNYGLTTGGALTFSGNPVVDQMGIGSSIKLGTLTSGASITITPQNDDFILVPAADGGTQTAAQYFKINNNSSEIFWDAAQNGIRVHKHTLQYAGKRVDTQYCPANRCDQIVETCATCDHTATMTLVSPGNTIYDGKEHKAKLVISDGYAGRTTPSRTEDGYGTAHSFFQPDAYTVTYTFNDYVGDADYVLEVEYIIYEQAEIYPRMPSAVNVTATTIQVSEGWQTNDKRGVGQLQYALSTSNTAPANGWQSSTKFSGLSPETTYYAFARYAGSNGENANTPTAPAVTGPSAPITTKRVFDVTLEPNGGAINDGHLTEYNEGEGAPLPTDVTKEGYHFAGWYEESDFSGTAVAMISAADSGEKTFYAKWLSSDTGITNVTVSGTVGTISGTAVSVALPAGTAIPTDSSAVVITPAAGASVSALQTSDSGATWTFTVTAEDGVTQQAYSIHVSVMEPPIKITTQPKDTTLYAGQDGYLTISTSPAADDYTWYKSSDGGASFSAQSVYGYSFLPLSSTQAANYLYYCVVTKDGYELKSDTVTVKFIEDPKCTIAVTYEDQSVMLVMRLNDTIDAIKTVLQEQFSVLPDEQRLYHNSKLLEAGKILSDYGIKDGSVLVMKTGPDDAFVQRNTAPATAFDPDVWYGGKDALIPPTDCTIGSSETGSFEASLPIVKLGLSDGAETVTYYLKDKEGRVFKKAFRNFKYDGTAPEVALNVQIAAGDAFTATASAVDAHSGVSGTPDFNSDAANGAANGSTYTFKGVPQQGAVTTYTLAANWSDILGNTGSATATISLLPLEHVAILVANGAGVDPVTVPGAPENSYTVSYAAHTESGASLNADGKPLTAGRYDYTLWGKNGYYAYRSGTVNVGEAKYTVTVQHDSNGTACADAETAMAGTDITLTAAPNTGYHFKEWQVVSGNVSIAKNQFSMSAENVTVKAIFELNTYTVAWVNEDGTELEKDTDVPYGATPSYDGETPTKAATPEFTYTFKEWTPAIASVTGNVTYTAAFTNTANTYTVTFDANGGMVTPAQSTVAHGGTLANLPMPVQTGCIFGGWFTGKTDGQEITAATVFTGNTTIYAHWTPCDHAGSVDQPDCDHAAACSLCGGKIAALGHDFANSLWMNADPAGHYKQCLRCNTPDVANLGSHIYDGYADIECNTCGYVRTLVTYMIIEGADQAVGFDEMATFASDAGYSKYVKTQVDGKDVPAGCCTVIEGSPRVTLSADFIRTLSIGKHTLTIVSADGSASTRFTIQPAVSLTYAVTIQTDGNGTASAAPVAAGQGETITLTAIPNTGYSFKAWEIVSGSVRIMDNQFTMPAGNVTVRALFEKDAPAPVPVVTSPTQEETVSVCEGEQATLAVAAKDADHYQWYMNRNDGKGFVAIAGATTARYTSSAVKLDNDGFRYYCTVSNTQGAAATSPVFTLHVPQTPDLPQTDDNSFIHLWCVMLVLSFAGFFCLSLRKKAE